MSDAGERCLYCGLRHDMAERAEWLRRVLPLTNDQIRERRAHVYASVPRAAGDRMLARDLVRVGAVRTDEEWAVPCSPCPAGGADAEIRPLPAAAAVYRLTPRGGSGCLHDAAAGAGQPTGGSTTEHATHAAPPALPRAVAPSREGRLSASDGPGQRCGRDGQERKP